MPTTSAARAIFASLAPASKRRRAPHPRRPGRCPEALAPFPEGGRGSGMCHDALGPSPADTSGGWRGDACLSS